ncbi:MAG: M28 family peptidase [Anaerolineales bacterium]|nr:M28 family peptidase [Anaerolineales bacterium]
MNPKNIPEFSGERAYQDVIKQVSMGPRIPGSSGHANLLEWLEEELRTNQWEVEKQIIIYQGKEVINLIASRGTGEGYILLGAHYDTRIFADQDPVTDQRQQPVPGANDGASGVAVLLELARILPRNLHKSVKLVFFDAEDNGGIEDWDWILGSKAFIQEIKEKPAAAIIVDMIGDADLEVYYEHNSDEILMDQIWKEASNLGYGSVFVNEYKFSILDDHTPFVEAGIPAVDLIDFDYPFWHTTEDTVDKVSPASLKIIGDTLATWLVQLD